MTQTTPIRIRLSPPVRERVRQAAEADHRSMTSWIEKLIMDSFDAKPAAAALTSSTGEELASSDYVGV